MRIVILGALSLMFSASPWSRQLPQSSTQQQSTPRPAGAGDCGASKSLANGDYLDAVTHRIWPPFLPLTGGTTITVGGPVKLILHTDGEKFQLLADTIDTPEKSLYLFLKDLDDSCRLPADPADAFALLKIHWETKDLSRAEFETLHRDFMNALYEYVSTVRATDAQSMATRLWVVYTDASYWPVVYDNTFQHLEIHAWDVPLNHKTNPMISWERELEKAAEESFGRPVLGIK